MTATLRAIGLTLCIAVSACLGSILYVSGIGQGVAHDRGGAIRGKRIDYYRPTHQEALNWGVQHRRVLVWISK